MNQRTPIYYGFLLAAGAVMGWFGVISAVLAREMGYAGIFSALAITMTVVTVAFFRLR
ncbi:hypothetical protein QE370_001437 [Aeromicrobium sp. SORGH_AS981]|jgi:hypothetical protein|nr:hypothetical protein [Aeromicrobium sp. SORGH_AS_0981]